MPFEVGFFSQYFILQDSVVLVVLIQAVFLWEADKGYTNTLSHSEKNLQLSHRKCSHEARVGVGSTEDKKGDLSSKGPVIHSNPDKTLQRCVWLCCVWESTCTCIMAMLVTAHMCALWRCSVWKHTCVYHDYTCEGIHVCTKTILCVRAHMSTMPMLVCEDTQVFTMTMLVSEGTHVKPMTMLVCKGTHVCTMSVLACKGTQHVHGYAYVRAHMCVLSRYSRKLSF